MDLRILDLDGGVSLQSELVARYQPIILPAQDWGPSIRLACSFARFRRFERDLGALCQRTGQAQPSIIFYGSGDFHHVSLALVRRLPTPVNLLVLDNHPDWMRGVPFLHCGTWLYHAARLPGVGRVFHVGGDVDFDNYFRWMAPWYLLRSGKIVVFPGIRRFRRGAWTAVNHEPLRAQPELPLCRDRIEELLAPFRDDLANLPLYVSLDKDVLQENEAVVNWDSGHLTLTEVCDLLRAFIGAARGQVAGIDIVGDWSPVRLRGWLRHVMHWTEHPPLAVDGHKAARRNEETNRALLQALHTAPASMSGASCVR